MSNPADFDRLPSVIAVMGVSGSGKSSVAERIAKAIAGDYLDADDYHPPANVAKMESGTALTDEDRAGWLRAINKVLRTHDRAPESRPIVLACSALKAAYRQALEDGLSEPVYWVYLKGDKALLRRRMQGRVGHFMPTGLLDSQLETLEEPRDALVVSIDQSLEDEVAEIVAALRRD